MSARDRVPDRSHASGWPEEGPAGSITFIVRLTRDRSDGLTGIVEHVRTGRKERFARLQEIEGVIASLLRAHVDP